MGRYDRHHHDSSGSGNGGNAILLAIVIAVLTIAVLYLLGYIHTKPCKTYKSSHRNGKSGMKRKSDSDSDDDDTTDEESDDDDTTDEESDGDDDENESDSESDSDHQSDKKTHSNKMNHKSDTTHDKKDHVKRLVASGDHYMIAVKMTGCPACEAMMQSMEKLMVDMERVLLIDLAIEEDQLLLTELPQAHQKAVQNAEGVPHLSVMKGVEVHKTQEGHDEAVLMEIVEMFSLRPRQGKAGKEEPVMTLE